MGASTTTPFAELPTLIQRPMHIVIPWGPDVPPEREGVCIELSNHFAGAWIRAGLN